MTTEFTCKLVSIPGKGDPHSAIPVSAYYLAHLLSALASADRNGDWWWEIQYWLREAHLRLGEPELIDNDGNRWSWIEDSVPGGELWRET